MPIEKAIFRPEPIHATPKEVLDFFGEVFAALDRRERPVDVELDFSESDMTTPMTLDMDRGEPRFDREGFPCARGRLGGRWLAEHAVPMALSSERAAFRLRPADAGRVRVTAGG